MPCSTHHARRLRQASLVGIFVALVALGHGQQVIAPINLETVQPEKVSESAPPPIAEPVLPPTPFQTGSLALHPHLMFRYLYGDGIQPRPGVDVTTDIYSISPGLLLNIGENWSIDYTPTWNYYSNDAFRDAVDQYARLAGILAYGNWGFQLSQDYSDTTQPLIETGAQTEQQSYNSLATVSYQLGSKGLADLSMRYAVLLAEGAPDSRDRSATGGFRYAFTPAFDAGFTFGVGKVKVSAGSDMTYYQPQVRFTWKPTRKFNVSVTGGRDFRKFETGTAEDVENPIINGELSYQPFESTRFTARIGRTVTASYFESQITENETWGLGYEQRLVEHWFLTADYTHYDTSYVATDVNVVTNRQDDTDTFNARLTTAILRRATVSLVYYHSRNDSSVAGFGVSSQQVGFEVSYRY